jgi:hypothetical protein
MMNSESGELIRLMREASTFTGRTPATVLVLSDAAVDGLALLLGSFLGAAAAPMRIDSSEQSQITALKNFIQESYSRQQPVLVELAADPHPEFIAILERAARDGTYPWAEIPGSSPEYRPIPEACPITVVAKRSLINTKISYPEFFKLFEIVETFPSAEVPCQN